MEGPKPASGHRRKKASGGRRALLIESILLEHQRPVVGKLLGDERTQRIIFHGPGFENLPCYDMAKYSTYEMSTMEII